jgi:hypothetical protein
MYRSIILGTAASVALTASAFAAEGWGINHEKVTRVEAKVVDLLCEVTGNCVANCGNGKRQLGLLFANGKLVPVVKNNDPFAGAIADLQPYCGKRIVADGLLISNPKMSMFQLQFLRAAPKGQPKGKWSGAKGFSRNWAKAHPGKKGAQWFRHDQRVKDLIAKDGVLGIPGLKPPE